MLCLHIFFLVVCDLILLSLSMAFSLHLFSLFRVWCSQCFHLSQLNLTAGNMFCIQMLNSSFLLLPFILSLCSCGMAVQFVNGWSPVFYPQASAVARLNFAQCMTLVYSD